MWYIKHYLAVLEDIMIDEVDRIKRFVPPVPFRKTIESAEEVISLGCKMGEGWLLTAEMRDLAEMGYRNIICAQPFGCLPNHIVGKGMIRRLKELDEQVNIVPIDYDPGATRVNQENRIKLMLAVANENRMEELERKRANYKDR
jgi:predicted nucleotide-binding protein (sugar kinase/HSP70/actin superfamily)